MHNYATNPIFPQYFLPSFIRNANPAVWEVSKCPLNGTVDDLLSLLVGPELSLIEAFGCNLTGTLNDLSSSWRQGGKMFHSR